MKVWRKKLILGCQCILLVAAILTGTGFYSLRAQAFEGDIEKKRVYLVRQGECLSSIAMEMYGDAGYWHPLYEHNRELIGEDPNYLKVGVYLELPEAPEKGLVWDTIYEKMPEDYSFTAFDSYISPEAPYRIEECYYYRYTQDEKYGKWEQEAGKYNVCYPQLISLNGRDMKVVNEAIRERAMALAEEYYIDVDGEAQKRISEGPWRDIALLWSTERYRITYLDENLLSIVFEHYDNNGMLTQLLKETHSLESLVINLETGHVYTCDQIFANKQELAEEEYNRILQKYGEEDMAYEFFSIVETDPLKSTLFIDRKQDNKWKTVFFLDGTGVHLAFNYNVFIKEWFYEENAGLWKDYQVTDFSAEEIAAYQSDSQLWQQWKPMRSA